MKYVRTTNGRIVDRLSDFNCFKSHGTTGRYVIRTLEDDNDLELWLKYNKTSIINQADTIEELCDYFAFEDAFSDNSTIRFQPVLFTSHSFAKLQAKNQNRPIIAYIVIEKEGVKTLEPVAKMNDKGEWELL